MDDIVATAFPRLRAIITACIFAAQGMAALAAPTSVPSLAWRHLAHVKPTTAGSAGEPRFHAAVQRATGHVTSVRGYMVPLDGSLSQRHFLLVESPTSCHDEPESVIYVKPASPVTLRTGPVEVRGEFAAKFNPATGMYYRMQAAKVRPITSGGKP